MLRRATVPALVALIAAFTQIQSHAGQPRTSRGKAIKSAQELPGPQRPYVPARPEAMGEWPSMITLVGPWRRPKPGFAALARTYQPVLPSIERTPETFTPERPVVATVWIVNDSWTGFDEASLEWTLRRARRSSSRRGRR
jgi:hypothetical protein